MKRVLSVLLALAMLLGLSVTASAASFSDVPAGASYAEAVNWAAVGASHYCYHLSHNIQYFCKVN